MDLEAPEKRVAVTENVLVQAGLEEIRTKIQEINEKLTSLQGNWKQQLLSCRDLIRRLQMSELDYNRQYRSGKQD